LKKLLYSSNVATLHSVLALLLSSFSKGKCKKSMKLFITLVLPYINSTKQLADDNKICCHNEFVTGVFMLMRSVEFFIVK